jgi:hypothetical protein
MGKTKSNPLKYFNDQRESRNQNMGKALKRFQDENSIPGAPPMMTSNTSGSKPLEAKLTFGNKSDEGAETERTTRPVLDVMYSGVKEGNKMRTSDIGVSASSGPFKGGVNYNKDQGLGANVGVTKGAFSADVGYNKGQGFTGSVGYNRGPVNVNLTYGKRKGGSTSKKKK